MPETIKVKKGQYTPEQIAQIKATGVDVVEEEAPPLTASDQKSVMKPASTTPTGNVAEMRTKATPNLVEEASPYGDKTAAIKGLNSAAEQMSSLTGYVDKAGFPALTVAALKKKIQGMTPQQQAEIWTKLQSIPKAADRDNYLLQLQ